MYTKKVTYKGMPQEKLKEYWSDYDPLSVECQDQNIDGNLTNEEKAELAGCCYLCSNPYDGCECGNWDKDLKIDLTK